MKKRFERTGAIVALTSPLLGISACSALTSESPDPQVTATATITPPETSKSDLPRTTESGQALHDTRHVDYGIETQWTLSAKHIGKIVHTHGSFNPGKVTTYEDIACIEEGGIAATVKTNKDTEPLSFEFGNKNDTHSYYSQVSDFCENGVLQPLNIDTLTDFRQVLDQAESYAHSDEAVNQ
ncbi:MAG TPA: hypothetical protein VF575_02855 [Candidatus Saccharimonadales bacterium]